VLLKLQRSFIAKKLPFIVVNQEKALWEKMHGRSVTSTCNPHIVSEVTTACSLLYYYSELKLQPGGFLPMRSFTSSIHLLPSALTYVI